MTPEAYKKAIERRKIWGKQNRHKLRVYERERRRAERLADPVAASARNRVKTIKQYGMTVESWEAMFMAQDRRCACCGSAETSKKGWHTDHDHTTGVVRGILCSWCNMGIGQFDDNPALLVAAAAYLDPSIERVDEHY